MGPSSVRSTERPFLTQKSMLSSDPSPVLSLKKKKIIWPPLVLAAAHEIFHLYCSMQDLNL